MRGGSVPGACLACAGLPCGGPSQVWNDERARLERELASVSSRMASVLERHNTADPEEHRVALARIASLEANLAESNKVRVCMHPSTPSPACPAAAPGLYACVRGCVSVCVVCDGWGLLAPFRSSRRALMPFPLHHPVAARSTSFPLRCAALRLPFQELAAARAEQAAAATEQAATAAELSALKQQLPALQEELASLQGVEQNRIKMRSALQAKNTALAALQKENEELKASVAAAAEASQAGVGEVRCCGACACSQPTAPWSRRGAACFSTQLCGAVVPSVAGFAARCGGSLFCVRRHPRGLWSGLPSPGTHTLPLV